MKSEGKENRNEEAHDKHESGLKKVRGRKTARRRKSRPIKGSEEKACQRGEETKIETNNGQKERDWNDIEKEQKQKTPRVVRSYRQDDLSAFTVNKGPARILLGRIDKDPRSVRQILPRASRIVPTALDAGARPNLTVAASSASLESPWSPRYELDFEPPRGALLQDTGPSLNSPCTNSVEVGFRVTGHFVVYEHLRELLNSGLPEVWLYTSV
ncbi:hypothetical protein KM043_010001 [Ampulex compressa]|nr:hypothetical protein KM043_010001 [Ampulex compressa]